MITSVSARDVLPHPTELLVLLLLEQEGSGQRLLPETDLTLEE